jgi:hypothetical protein
MTDTESIESEKNSSKKISDKKERARERWGDPGSPACIGVRKPHACVLFTAIRSLRSEGKEPLCSL